MSKINNSLLAKAKYLFRLNHKVGDGFDYTCPSVGHYPHQWLWDSSFHSIVLSVFDNQRAIAEIKTLLLNQKENGFVPCVSIWKKNHPFEHLFYTANITQPPVIPLAVEIVYKRTKNLKFVSEVYPKLKNFLSWLDVNRDKNNNGLIEIIHPWEDGDDGNPSFDSQMGFGEKPGTIQYFFSLFKILFIYNLLGWNDKKIFKENIFRSETVLFNSIYARSLLAMSNLASIIKKEDDQKFYKASYSKVKNAIIKQCWNKKDEIFYDLDNESKQSHVKNISSLMALIMPDLPKKIVISLIEKHLLNKNEFWTKFPIPSVAINEKTFNPGKSFALWRGPVWINTNWFLFNALKHYGYKKSAQDLSDKTKDMITKRGFWEFYNPLTGEGYGVSNFGWSTLVTEM